MSPREKSIRPAAALLAVLAAASPHAALLAAEPGFCEGYAGIAVEQNAENLERGCGFVGARWTSDYQGHYYWCLGVDEQVAEGETEARRAALDNECAPGRRTELCERYAREAVEQQAENLERDCGFEDPRWHSDYDRHLAWCLEVTDEMVRQEAEARASALERECFGREPMPGAFEEVPYWRRADLAVVELAVPERAAGDEQVVLRATISNLGRGPAAAAEAVFRVDDKEIASSWIDPLAAAAASEVAAVWTAQRPGRHAVAFELLLGACASDADGGNHLATATIRVAGEENPQPEIETELRVAAPGLRAGQPARLDFTFHNPGFALVRDLPAEIRVDDEVIDATTIDLLETGETASYEVEWLDVSPGQHTIELHLELPADYLDAEARTTTSWAATVSAATTSSGLIVKDWWVSLGPSLLNNGSVGRMDGIAFHPTSAKILHAAAPTGGLWTSDDGGDSWSPTGDQLARLDFNSVAIDPKRPQIVYAMGGYWAAFSWGTDAPLFKSIDGGKSWLPFVSGIAQGTSGLVVPATPSGAMIVYAGTNRGLLRYKSNLPKATSGTASDFVTLKAGVIEDFAVAPADESLIYASVRKRQVVAGKSVLAFDGLYRSKNAAGAASEAQAGWTKLTKGLPANATGLTVDIFHKDPKILFAAARVGGGVNIYRSANAGDSWTYLLRRNDSGNPNDVQYNPFVRSHRSKEAVYFGGGRLYKAERNASTGKWTDREVTGLHVDLKELRFSPHATDSYFALSDGGIWRCTFKAGGDDSCQHRNNDLRTTQFFDIDAASQSSDLIIGGTQDNGTILYEGKSVWREVRGGDGLYSLIAPSNNKVWYSQLQALQDTARSADGGKSWVGLHKLDTVLPRQNWSGGRAFITVHPKGADAIYGVGQQVHASSDGGRFWSAIGPSGKTVKGNVSRVAVNPATGRVFAGTGGGQIWERSGGWSLVDSHPDSGASVSNLVFAPSDPKVMYVTYNGADPYRRIQRLELQPAGWTGSWITDNLPKKHAVSGTSLEIVSLAGDGYKNTVVYVGTDKGVYRGIAPCGSCTYDWKPYSLGLPLVKVRDLVVDPQSRRLRAATWGRGLWTVVTGP